MERRRLIGLLTGVIVVVSACGGSSSDTTTTGAADTGAADATEAETSSTPEGGTEINIGIFPVISPIPVMQEQGMLEEMGYTVNWVPVNSGLPGAASALAAGQLDMVHANSSSGTIIFSTEPDAAYFVGRSFINLNETVVSNASDASGIEDLADRTVVVSGLKTASTLFYEMGLTKAGVIPNRDLYYVAGTGPGMVDVLASGGTEVAATYVPYSSAMSERGIGELLFTASDALGRTEPGDGLFVTRAFAEENPEAVEDVLRSMFAAMDTIKEDPESVIDLLAEFAGVEADTIRVAFEGDIVPDSYVPDVEAMIEVAEVADENGFAPEGVDNLPEFASEFANPTFAENAASS